jgi:Protein of unknown function (DUF3987)/Bifunctional DNA primase/polymerase, N-terminal
LGRSGLFVVDLDKHPGGADGVTAFKAFRGSNPPPRCPTVKTPSGGFHLYFRQPQGEPLGNRTGTLPAGVDCRGAGGWTVAPGAVFGPWIWAGSAAKLAEAQPVSGWILSAVQAKKNEYSGSPSLSDVGKCERAYAEAALANAANQVAASSHGRRNSELNTAAFCMGTMVARGWIGGATVEGRLHDAATACGLPTNEARKTIKSGIEAGLKEPHADLPERSQPTPQPKSGNGATTWLADSSSAHDWSDPDPSILDDRRGDLPSFPTDIFTPPIRGWLERAAHGAGVYPDHVALPLLGVTSSLIGTARRVQASRPWSEPMTLWSALVGFSGDRKTPGFNVVRRALDMIERDQVTAIAAARLVHETRVQRSKEAAKKWKEERQAAIEDKPPRDPPAMPLEALDPGNFIEPRLYATDPTIERLAGLLQVRPRGMMLLRDELAGLFANMGRYSGGSDRPFWLEAWVGGRHVVERVSGSIVINHLLVGVIGGFQPDKLARAFSGDEDGMYGRFLYGWPSTPDYRPLTNDVAEVEPELQSALKALIRLPAEDSDDAFIAQAVPLSQDAVEEFESYRRHVDKLKRALDGLERQWLVKSESQVLRLAGTLTYLAWAFALGTPGSNGMAMITADLEPKQIGKEFMSAAVRAVKEYFWHHARAALRQIGLTDRHRNMRRVLRWISAHEKQEVSREDIRRDALGQSLDAERTQELLDDLVKTGWLQADTAKTAGRARRRWRANPKLFVQSTAGSAGSAGSPSQGYPASNTTEDYPPFRSFRTSRNRPQE